ncbi:MAG: tripartite tricarboxylate transporter substrate binding protein [Burkholderiales bacterium]|nr:tripartite tricarboxylate transporter substrate binding protein [Burkholderiales bacterium]
MANTKRWHVAALAAATMGCVAGYVQAAESTYPQRPVRMMVSYPPGGPSDLTARLVGPRLTEALGQQVVIDNRGGAGGTLAVTLLTQAAPDGHTLLMSAGGEIVIAPNLRLKLPYDPTKDIRPISRVGASQLVLVVHPSVQAKSVKDMIALAKAKPGALNFASAGAGSTAHLAGEQFKHLANIDIVHIPYKGAGPALAELMAGQVHMLISAYSSAFAHIQAGKLRALGVTGTKRLASAPDLPTIAETVPGYEVLSWYGVHAPKGTAPAIVSRLHRELSTIVRRPEISERLAALGIEPEGNSPDEFLAQIKAEIAAWGKVITAAKLPKE